MAADTQNALSKVDSLTEEQPKAKSHRRASSMAADVYNMADLGELPSPACLPACLLACRAQPSDQPE